VIRIPAALPGGYHLRSVLASFSYALKFSGGPLAMSRRCRLFYAGRTRSNWRVLTSGVGYWGAVAGQANFLEVSGALSREPPGQTQRGQHYQGNLLIDVASPVPPWRAHGSRFYALAARVAEIRD